MESISIANKILQDSLRDTRQKCYGIHINRKQDPTRSYKILLDKNDGIHINSKQDPTRFYGILDKNAMESISIANKILQDPTRFYGILDKNAMESISIANKILQDSTGY